MNAAHHRNQMLWKQCCARRINFVTIWLLSFLVPTLLAFSQQTDEKPIVRFGVIGRDPEQRPDQPTAFVLEEISQLQDVQIEFVPLPRGRFRRALIRGEIDFVSLSHSPQLEFDYELSQPYSQQPLAIFRHVGARDIVDEQSLTGHRVGVRNNDALRDALAERTDAEFEPFNNILRGLLALDRGEIDAFVAGQSRGANTVLKQDLHNIEMTAAGFMSNDICFVARKGNRELISMLDEGLSQLEQSGRLQEFLQELPQGQLATRSWIGRNQLLLSVITIVTVLLLFCIAWIVLLLHTNRTRRQAQRAIEEYEHRFRCLFDSNILGTVSGNTQGAVTEANDAFLTMIGYDRDDLPFDWRDITPPEWLDASRDAALQTQTTGRAEPFEKEYLRKDGSRVRALLGVAKIQGSENETICFTLDLTERQRSREALEQSLSVLQSTLESTADGILVVDSMGKIVASNGRFRELWRIPDSIMESGNDEQVISYVLEQLEDPQEFLRKVGDLYNQPEAESFDVLRFIDGRVYERYSRPQRIGDKSVGRVWSFRDVTERTAAEQRQTKMITELDHRVKNMLATVQAISDETLQTADSPDVFAELFRGRIASLARVHEVLAQRRWQGANLRELIDQLVSPYADDDTSRIDISGDDVILPVASVLPFSLALHELATNAAKYGALSVPQGNVDIKWNRSKTDMSQLLFQWIERDGPTVAPPSHTGFGTRFIKQGITYELGGQVDLRFVPTGVQCDMTIPITASQGQGNCDE